MIIDFDQKYIAYLFGENMLSGVDARATYRQTYGYFLRKTLLLVHQSTANGYFHRKLIINVSYDDYTFSTL